MAKIKREASKSNPNVRARTFRKAYLKLFNDRDKVKLIAKYLGLGD